MTVPVMESEKKNGPDAAELLRVREFCRTLEEAAANLPDDVRAALYRPQVAAGFVETPAHCECSRQSILYVLRELLPGRRIRGETLRTVLSGGGECRFRVTVG